MTTIDVDGATNTIYIQQTDGDFAYTINQETESASIEWSVTIQNTNLSPSTNILKVYFTTDLTLTNANEYSIVNSDGIQIGNTMLNSDGIN